MVDLTFPQSKRRLVPYYIDPEDTKIYEWRIFNSSSRYFRIAYFLAYVFGLCFFTQGFVWGILKIISLISLRIALTIGTLLLLIFFITTILIIFNVLSYPAKKLMISLYLFLSIGIIFFLVSTPDSNFQRGFITSSNFNFNEWVMYFVQQGLNVFLIDIPDTFNIELSSIQPALSNAKIITVIIKFYTSVGFLQIVASAFTTIFSSKQFYGTVEDCIIECLRFLDIFGFAESDDLLSFVLVRKEIGVDDPSIVMLPNDFLRFLKSSNKYSDLFEFTISKM